MSPIKPAKQRRRITSIVFLITFLLQLTKFAFCTDPHPQPFDIITIVYEEEEPDQIASQYIHHFNATVRYFDIDQERLEVSTLKLPDGKFGDPIPKLRHGAKDASVLISLAKTATGIKTVKNFAESSEILTIQLWMNAWNATTSNNGCEAEDDLSNYVAIIPSFIVFDNILHMLVAQLNITSEILILYDPFYDTHAVYNWKKPFTSLPVAHKFESMFEQDDAIKLQIQQLQFSAKNIFIMARTALVEKYLTTELRFQFEAKKFTNFVVFSKDTLSFRCESCTSVNLFWVRLIPNGRVETLRTFGEYVKDKELDVELKYRAKSFDEIQVSYCLDVVSLVYEYLMLKEKQTSASQLRFKSLLEASADDNDTVATESSSSADDSDDEVQADERSAKLGAAMRYEYGSYHNCSANVYFQNPNAAIFKVERHEDQPENAFHKYIAKWTINDGIMPFYYNLGVDITQINHVRIVTIIQKPFIERNESGHYDGYCMQLLNHVIDDLAGLNLTYEIFLVPDGKFGTMDDNGGWNGLMGVVVNGLADFALGPISATAEREIDVDFTVPFYDLVGITILMRRSDNEYSLFKFVKILEWPVWLCIFSAYLVTSLLLCIFDKFSPYSYTNNQELYVCKSKEAGRIFTFRECLWFCITSLTPQGGGEAPKNVSSRLVAATWWLFGFIILASYTANFAAFLTVSKREQTISGLDDLAKQYKIGYATLKGGSSETYFRRMAEIEEEFYRIWKQMSLNESMDSRDRAKLAVWDYPLVDQYTNMWRFMKDSGFPNTVEEAIERVLESPRGRNDKPFAFLGDAMAIKYATLTNCRLQQVGAEISRKPYAVATQTGHPLKDKISATILKMLNKRELEKMKEEWWHQNPNRVECPNMEDESSGISIQNIGGVFIVIIAGVAISLVILLFEYLYANKIETCENDEIEMASGREKSPVRSTSRNQSPSINGRIVVRRETPSINAYYSNSAFSKYEDHD